MAKRKRPSKTWEERKNGVKSNVQAALDKDDMVALERALTPLQRKFAEEYIVDFNGKQACIRCGSTTAYPDKLAYIWLNNRGVRRYIEHLTADRTAQLKIDHGYVIQKLLRTLEKAEGTSNHTAALRAIEMLAKHLGMFSDRVELTGKDGGAIEYEKVQNDAESFLSSIAGLAKRGGEGEVSKPTEH